MPLLLHHGPIVSEAPGRSISDRFESLIVVLPTKRRIRHLSREVMTRADAVPALPFHTLESLACSVYGAIDGVPQIIGGAIQTLLFSTAIRESAQRLRYFKLRGKEKQPFRGTFEKIIDVITNLKESGISPASLREEAAAGPPDEQAKLLDMAIVYETYEEHLSLLRADDLAGVYRYLSSRSTQQQFETAFRSLFPSVTFVSLAGFDEFTQPEIGFINRICSIPALSVSLLFDFLPGNRGLFGHLEENYDMFRHLGFSAGRTLPEREDVTFGLPASNHEPSVRAASQHLARTLFNSEFDGERRDLSRQVTLIRARNRRQEIEHICKLIKRLLIERPELDPATICVAMIHPQHYTDIVREAFPRYGIPVNITDRYSLSRSPLVTALVALLQIPLAGYRRDDVLRATQTPYASIPGRSGEIDVQNLEEVSRHLRIVGGYKTWLEKIQVRRGKLAAERGASTQDTILRELSREDRRLARAEDDIQTLDLVLRDVSREQTPSDFRNHLLQLIDRLGIPARLVDGSIAGEGDLMEKDVRAYAKFREVLDDVIALFEFQEGSSSVHPARFYVDQLKIAISNERYNIRERFGQGVLVTSIEETRGLPVDVMIVAGMVDGEFPSVYQPEVFFSAHRQELRERRHIWQNRYLFYQAVTNWSSHLYMTYPERDNELDLVRSSFVDAVLKIALVEELPSSAAFPWTADIASRDEFLEWHASRSPSHGTEPDVPDSLREPLRTVREAIAVEKSRLSDHSMPAHEGLILNALGGERRGQLSALRERIYSASQLETFGRCPYSFFADRILRLSAVEPFEEDLTPRERGSIIHAAMFEFYLDRRTAGKPPLAGCSNREFEEARTDLARILTAKLDAVDIPDPFWMCERELMLGRPGTEEGLVYDFLECERKRSSELKPSFFEVSFGSQPRHQGTVDPLLSIEEPIDVGRVHLAGKIDRIDLGDGFFTIVDYKSGSIVPTITEIRNGLSLQLPLYLMAVTRLLNLAGNRASLPAGAFYYKLGKKVSISLGLGNEECGAVASGHRGRSGQLLPTQAEFDRELADAVRRIEQYVDEIAGGNFPLTTPERIEKVCRYCDFKSMCRIQTFRHVQQETPEDA